MQTFEFQPTVDQFCEDINKVIDILKDHTQSQLYKSQLSILLSGCLIGVYEDLLSAELLVSNHRFLSLLKIARSLYDLALQLAWIKNLKGKEQQEAIETFLSFTGKENKNEWYKLIDPTMTMGKMARYVNLGHSVYNADMTALIPNDSPDKGTVDIYGYLSKTLHWNPSYLKNLIGIKDGKIQVKPGSQIITIYIGTLAIRIAAFIFTGIWLEEFFQNGVDIRKDLDFLLSEIIIPAR